jgi:predicted esterase
MGSLPVTSSRVPSTTLTSPPSPSTAHLPAILCLHGGGSNSTVFKIQTRRLYWRLSSRFRFVFVQGPLGGDPGWDVMPTFESLKPFYRWVSRRFQIGDGGHEVTPQKEVQVIDQIILEAMEENGGRDSFVGVMGFSQGARLAAGMLLRQQLELRHYGASKWGFKFGVVIGGPFPPIALNAEGIELDYSVLGQVPTVHAWGRDDPVRWGAKDMADACDSPNTFVMDFAGGHHLPLVDEEAEELCGLIVDAWHASGGSDRGELVDNTLERES